MNTQDVAMIVMGIAIIGMLVVSSIAGHKEKKEAQYCEDRFGSLLTNLSNDRIFIHDGFCCAGDRNQPHNCIYLGDNYE